VIDTVEPRQFFSMPDMPSGGMPQDRASRLAARRAFVDLKTVFAAAVNDLPGQKGEWLRQQIRGAEEPIDLWLLRAPVMEALSELDEATRQWRLRLRRSLDSLFPETELASGFGRLG
jgi:hypothetical protein